MKWGTGWGVPAAGLFVILTVAGCGGDDVVFPGNIPLPPTAVPVTPTATTCAPAGSGCVTASDCCSLSCLFSQCQ